jgi:acyl carrier protein
LSRGHLNATQRRPFDAGIEASRGDGLFFQVSNGVDLSYTKADIQEKILGFIRSEIQDKSIPLALDTPIDSTKIDSIDVIHVIFKVEEEFKAEVSLSNDVSYATVGEFIDALMGFIPADQIRNA